VSKLTPLVVIALVFAAFAVSLSQTGEKSIVQTEAERLVEQMRGFSMQPAAGPRSDGTLDPREQRRQEITEQLRGLGKQAVPALVHALADPDVQMRRNAELVLIELGGAYSHSMDPKLKVDIREAIPTLITVMQDSDTAVRAWAAHALAEIGPDAKEAVPVLIKLLKDPEEGPRNTSCFALGRIGPAAKVALPALRETLNDPSEDVRRFAQEAIEKIEK
jgi:HEAT repeat protein